jgi:drug/metabolite transporter (DMT)-like permease
MLLLAALWGASFLFMRMGTPEFGPVLLVEVRLVIAAAWLVALVASRPGGARPIFTHGKPLAAMGVINTALPFVLLAYASLSLTAGFSSILNATTPFFAAIIAYVWTGTRLSRWRVLGLVIGFLGVVLLVWGKISFKTGGWGPAIVTALTAAASYGLAASYAKVRMPVLPPTTAAAGSIFWAAIILLPFVVAFPPPHWPSPRGWFAVISLGVLCTGTAYLLYFRLLKDLGPTGAVAVTFLIPAFAMLWGFAFLNEPVTRKMIAGTAIVLAGTALTAGLLPPPRRQRPATLPNTATDPALPISRD